MVCFVIHLFIFVFERNIFILLSELSIKEIIKAKAEQHPQSVVKAIRYLPGLRRRLLALNNEEKVLEIIKELSNQYTAKIEVLIYIKLLFITHLTDLKKYDEAYKVFFILFICFNSSQMILLLIKDHL